MSKKDQVPEKVKFKLILNQKYGAHNKVELEGVAVVMVGPNESSFDKDINGVYFAADYDFSLKNCSITIKLDIVDYMACFVSTTCTDMKFFLKSYPNYDIMKRVGYSN
jgi:hypothetical protein